MKFVSGAMNGTRLQNLHAASMKDAIQVKVAVAYANGTNMEIFEDCQRKKIQLDFFGRYDYSVPIHPSILKWFLDANDAGLTCKLVPDLFHPKVIWWVGSGAYIGSANLTSRAWETNCEAGIFLSQEELDAGMAVELNDFFGQLEKIATPLRRDIWLEQLELSKHGPIDDAVNSRRNAFAETRKIRPIIPPWVNQGQIAKTPYESFEAEWNSTIQLLQMIGKRVAHEDQRPAWIKADTPDLVQGDQFLHAYYYRNAKLRYRELYLENQSNRETALVAAMNEWSNLPPEELVDEATHMHEWAPLVESLCDRERLLDLTLDELATLFKHIHATRDHLTRRKRLNFMPPDAMQWTLERRIEALIEHLWNKRAPNKMSLPQVLHYVVWGKDGWETEPVTMRLWKASKGEAAIPHIGIGTLGEVLGWARPYKYPPRNGRTSKALMALGHTVDISL